MRKKKKLTSSEIDGVQYRRSPTWQIALAQMNGGAGMCFYILMGYASYVANAGYGILTAMVGLILTATRIFDGVTDPIIALIMDKMNTRFGKIRIIQVSGWLIQVLAIKILYDWASGKGHGIITFVLLYMLYIIGYTMNNVAAQVMGPVLSNDPKQRPMINVWSTIYNYFVPVSFSMVIVMGVLPKYNNQFSVPMLAEASTICVCISAVFLILSVIGISSVDKPENFVGIKAGNKEPVKIKDMIALFKSNRALQMYIVAATSDKIAMTVTSQAIIATMMYGIIIGNMQISSILGLIAMLPSIVFAIIGARYAGRYGNKESMVTWTKVCIALAVISIIFFVVIDPRSIASFGVTMILFVLLHLLLNGSKMCITTANGAMMADVIDFELERSGNYLPAVVSGTFMFIDKIVSSFGAVIATGCVALIGYTNTLPQPTDQLTNSIFWMAIGLFYGMPIIGWICTLFAMKFTPLSKEKMVEVQKSIADKKAMAQAEENVQ